MMTVKPSYEELEARCDRLARQIVFITDNAQKSVSRIHKELTSRLETAERELVAVKSTQVQHIVTTSYETARTAGIAIDEAVRVVAGWLVDDTDRRAREAEQAVARVREIAKADLKCPCCSGYEEILRTLDGE